MGFDGLGRNHELPCDLPVAGAPTEQAQHISFTIGQHDGSHGCGRTGIPAEAEIGAEPMPFGLKPCRLQEQGIFMAGLQPRQTGELGNGPEMVVSGLMNNRADAEGLFAGRDWSQLERRLTSYVENVKIKIAKPKGPFQL